MECKTSTAGIVLAAGTSSRFGKLKQLQVVDGKSLLEWTLDACLGSQLERICVPFYNNKRGKPVIFSKKFYAEISHIEGDVGARGIIDDNPSQVLSIALSRPSFFYDVDTSEDIEKMGALKKVDA